jgi:type II secretory pathway pseudopilin PulG
MMIQRLRTRAMTLIEVVVSATVISIVAIGYAALYNAQDAQRVATEELVVAMEMASRQIEFLRIQDPRSSTAPFNVPAATASMFLNCCIPVPYNSGRPLEEFGGGIMPEGEYLRPGNSYGFAANSSWVVGSGPSTPEALVMPAELVAKGYTVEVRAARVRSSLGLPSNSAGRYEQLLIHYQVTVKKNTRVILMLPYIRAVTVP